MINKIEVFSWSTEFEISKKEKSNFLCTISLISNPKISVADIHLMFLLNKFSKSSKIFLLTTNHKDFSKNFYRKEFIFWKETNDLQAVVLLEYLDLKIENHFKKFLAR